jgi:hypothetical protein
VTPTLVRPVRCDQKARPYYAAIPDEARAAIEASVPPGCYISVLDTNTSPRWSVRLYRDELSASQPKVLLAHLRGHHLEQTLRQVAA